VAGRGIYCSENWYTGTWMVLRAVTHAGLPGPRNHEKGERASRGAVVAPASRPMSLNFCYVLDSERRPLAWNFRSPREDWGQLASSTAPSRSKRTKYVENVGFSKIK